MSSPVPAPTHLQAPRQMRDEVTHRDQWHPAVQSCPTCVSLPYWLSRNNLMACLAACRVDQPRCFPLQADRHAAMTLPSRPPPQAMLPVCLLSRTPALFSVSSRSLKTGLGLRGPVGGSTTVSSAVTNASTSSRKVLCRMSAAPQASAKSPLPVSATTRFRPPRLARYSAASASRHRRRKS